MNLQYLTYLFSVFLFDPGKYQRFSNGFSRHRKETSGREKYIKFFFERFRKFIVQAML